MSTMFMKNGNSERCCFFLRQDSEFVLLRNSLRRVWDRCCVWVRAAAQAFLHLFEATTDTCYEFNGLFRLRLSGELLSLRVDIFFRFSINSSLLPACELMKCQNFRLLIHEPMRPKKKNNILCRSAKDEDGKKEEKWNQRHLTRNLITRIIEPSSCINIFLPPQELPPVTFCSLSFARTP